MDGEEPRRLPRIHLNVTRAEASHPAFLDRVGALLEGCEALSGRLCLEFDEASLGRGLSHFAGLVKRVSELGVETCIDHLGGSQSSLADLARLKIDRIKIHPASFAASGVVDAQALLVPARSPPSPAASAWRSPPPASTRVSPSPPRWTSASTRCRACTSADQSGSPRW